MSIPQWVCKIRHSGKKIFSQSNQDGKLEFIFENLEKYNKLNNDKFCVEFGYNSDTITGGSGPNTTNLINNHNFNHLLIDIEYENPSINLFKHHLTSDNICNIFKKYNVPYEPWYVSIDVDSVDLWLLKAILNEYKPYVITIEYNAHFPKDNAITFRDVGEEPAGNSNRVYGASLKAIDMVAKEMGYSIVELEIGLDAFLIRNDLIENQNINRELIFSDGYTTAINWHPPQFESLRGLNVFIDYEEYLKTNDIEKSRNKALSIVKKYIYRVIPNDQRNKEAVIYGTTTPRNLFTDEDLVYS